MLLFSFLLKVRIKKKKKKKIEVTLHPCTVNTMALCCYLHVAYIISFFFFFFFFFLRSLDVMTDLLYYT